MLPTFVIGLREGLEAALIIGIIAAFLRKEGRKDLLRWVFVGVGVAVVLCVGIGVGLKLASEELPHKQQEGLETVIGLIAVVMVTYMVVWMKRNSRGLKGQLEGLTAQAMTGHSRAELAMVAMAFLAVLREGIETAVFLLAAFNESKHAGTAATGAITGLLVAIALGYGIYRGGVKINLSKFFRATGLVLVFVAAGLVVNAFHTAHEAGWINFGQDSTIDLTWLVKPGSVQASLLTGMLGVQPSPVVIEIVAWLAYLVPVGLYVVWPPGKGLAKARLAQVCFATAAVLGLAALGLAVFAPAAPKAPASAGGTVTAISSDAATVLLAPQSPASKTPATRAPKTYALRLSGEKQLQGMNAYAYSVKVPGTAADEQPATVSVDQIAAWNGGRLPLGLAAGVTSVQAKYHDTDTLTVWIEPMTKTVLDVQWSEKVTATLTDPRIGEIPLSGSVAQGDSKLPTAQAAAAAISARNAIDDLNRRATMRDWAWMIGVIALLVLIGGVATLIAARPEIAVEEVPAADGVLVRS